MTNNCDTAEPDRSNPTRNRWERPLDTVRAFEAAIDGKYNRRAQAVAAASRRSSYQQGIFYLSMSFFV
jgi:hypothetical protein